MIKEGFIEKAVTATLLLICLFSLLTIVQDSAKMKEGLEQWFLRNQTTIGGN